MFGIVNWTDACTIAIEENTFYSMAASEVVEFYIQDNLQQENLHSEAANQSWSGKKYSQNLSKISGKYMGRSPLFSNDPSHSHLPRILLWSWVIIYDYFKNSRTTFFSRIPPNGCFNTLRVLLINTLRAFITVMLLLRPLTKYNLSGTIYRDSSLGIALLTEETKMLSE